MTFRAPPPDHWADAQPHAAWRTARTEGAAVPAAPSAHDPRPAVVVTRFDDCERVLRDPATFSSSIHLEVSGRFKGRTIVGMDGDEHRRHRALVAAAFRPSTLERWRVEAAEPIIHELLDVVAPRGEAELVSQVTSPFPVQVICSMIGLPREDHAQFLEWSERINYGALDPEAGYAAADALTEYLRPLVAARRTVPTGDLLSELVHAEVDGERISEELLFGFLRLLVPAGAETTYRAFGTCLAALLDAPDELARVTANRAALTEIIEETLRWETPVAMVTRVATRDTEIGACPVAAGTPVTVLTSCANRDERRYDEPDRWDPRREAATHLAFGTGPHQCLGISLARLELRVGLDAVLTRLPGLRLDPSQPPPVVAGYAFRGPDRLPVRFGAST
jgi:cytochrome P450